MHQQQQQQQGAATSAGVLNVARIKRIVKKATGSSKTDMQHAACSQASALELLRIAHTSDASETLRGNSQACIGEDGCTPAPVLP